MVAVTTYPTNAADATETRWRLMGSRRHQSGVHRGYHDDAEVTPASGMDVTVAAAAVGIDNIDGEWDDTITLSHSAAHATLHRTDLVVASLHLDASPLEIHVEVLTGSNAASEASASAPDVRSSSTRVDIPLAEVYVAPTVSAITEDDITLVRRWFPSTTDWLTWSPTYNVTSGSSFSIAASSTDVAEYVIDGSICEFLLKASMRLTGSNPGGLQFSLPVPAAHANVPFSNEAFNNAFRSKVAFNSTSGLNDKGQIDRMYLTADDTDTYQNFPTNAVDYGFRFTGRYRIRS